MLYQSSQINGGYLRWDVGPHGKHSVHEHQQANHRRRQEPGSVKTCNVTRSPISQNICNNKRDWFSTQYFLMVESQNV